jgi:hypothetical protein
MPTPGSTGARHRVPFAALVIVTALVASAVVVLIVVLLPARPGPAQPAGHLPTSVVQWEPDPCRSAMRGPC